MAALVAAEANRLLDASLGTAAYIAPTGDMKLALSTATTSASSAGTEVVGGSYLRQTISFDAASSQSAVSAAAISFVAMPAATVTDINIYDSNGSPRRAWWGPLTAPKTVGAGDTLTFADGAITVGLV